MSFRNTRRPRSGSIVVLSAFLIVILLAMVAFAVDIGYVLVVGSEMQRTADSASLAGTWELLEQRRVEGADNEYFDLYLDEYARMETSQYTGFNKVAGQTAFVNYDDVEVGFLADFSDPTMPLDLSDPSRFNAVRVRIHKNANKNGEIPFFFARAMGFTSCSRQMTATAAFHDNLIGFENPSDGSNLGILPFAFDKETWDAMMADAEVGVGDDDWAYDEATGQVSPGSDGLFEVNIYPYGEGTPGNRGTVDIGGADNSTAVIERQIIDGVSAEDLAYHDGEIRLDDNGELLLNGDTGISAGVKDELTDIIGLPKVVPLFREVVDPGNNCTYTIVQFVGVRVLDVDLTGALSHKSVVLQPSKVIIRGGIPAPPGSEPGGSTNIYSPVHLVY